MPLVWLPVPHNFAAQLRATGQIHDLEARLTALQSLAEHQLTFLETVQLDRAITRHHVESASSSPVRLAILASCTVEHLIPGIRVAGARRRLHFDVYVGTYGQYRQELLSTPLRLHEFAPQVVLLSLTAREVLASVPLTATAADASETIERFIEELRGLWRRIKSTFRAQAIQQTFLDITDPVFGSFDHGVPGAPRRVLDLLNDRLFDAAIAERVLVLDVARAAQRDGQRAWFDRARWFQAKQEISPSAVSIYGELLARLIAAQRGLSKKCLVLDLDNTLWHGVVGDDGIEGIVLGEGSAVGEAHAAVQRYALYLKNRGVILAICSKNDLTTAEEVFEKHPEMILRRSDISVFAANWNDKADNIKAIARQLNIGLDSLVFVDDNPAERARVREALPMVSVPELPADVADYVSCLADAGYFESLGFTSDDTQRTAQYAANAERESLRVESQSLDDFLRNLQMSVEYGPFAETDLARITQLINKTNQFNPTMRRYSADEVATLSESPDHLTMQFRLTDRFGDNGLVSAAVLAPDASDPDSMIIESWVMSCRVFGRQLEFEAMNILIESAARIGVRALRARHVPTARNGGISGLFGTLGFVRTSEVENTSGASEWLVKPSEYVPKQTHIARSHSRVMAPQTTRVLPPSNQPGLQ